MTLETVSSKDGTRLGVLRSGSGPGLVLVQGAVGTVEEYAGLADALSPHFTVWRPERRGRGLSPCAFDPAYGVTREVEDLEAVLAHAQAKFVFGLSSGAVIALTAVARGAAVERVVAFEPPLYSRTEFPRKDLERFWAAIAKHDLGAAMAAAGKAVGLMPWMRFVPDAALDFAVRSILARQPALAEMVPTLQFDFSVVSEMHGKTAEWSAIRRPVLLLGGSKSPPYLLGDLQTAQALIPGAERVVLDGLDHGSPWTRHPQRNARGNPARVAEEIRRVCAR
ncbi:MAG: alpha/beta hydrolase [Myxococcaceae bacterium]